MNKNELKSFLELKYEQYNNPKFEKKEDIEITGFLVSTIAWGNRRAIIKSGESLLKLMGNDPYEFILNYNSFPLPFVHRTFNSTDL